MAQHLPSPTTESYAISNKNHDFSRYIDRLTDFAMKAGAESEDLATAFVSGYQAAIRCIDTSLDQRFLASYCVNERNMSNLRMMETQWQHDKASLSGGKSYAALAGNGLDIVYVVARPSSQSPATSTKDLMLLRIKLSESNIKVVEPVKAFPIFPNLVHAALVFNNCHGGEVLYPTDAHQIINRPFRYWEDILVALSFSHWLMSRLPDNINTKKNLFQRTQALKASFGQHPWAYCAATLAAFELLTKCMNECSMHLTDVENSMWNRDSKVLFLGSKAREKLKMKFASEQ